jgi:single-strand DNA-binding protein
MAKERVGEMWRPPDPLDAVVVWRDQAEHAAGSLTKGSRVVVVGRLQQRSWTAEDGSARSTVEVVARRAGGKPAGGRRRRPSSAGRHQLAGGQLEPAAQSGYGCSPQLL